MLHILLFLLASSSAADSPKYGPQATRLFQAQEHVRKSPAPDFWALVPYYVHQQDGRSCSVASLAMVLNAARAGRSLSASDELVTQSAMLKKVNNAAWSRGVGPVGKGVTLAELGKIAEQSFKSYGFEKVSVEVIHMDASEPAQKRVREILAENEKSSKDFVIANFLQSKYTGDPEGGGHISPVAAYDGKGKRVLIFDTDRQYYEPYWVSEEVFFAGMATQDSVSGKNRGLVHVKLGN